MLSLATPLIVHHLEHCLLVLTNAREMRRHAVMQTPPGSVRFAGPGYWLAVKQRMEQECPAAPHTFIVDCGDAPGPVMACLRSGFLYIRFDGEAAVRESLSGMAAHTHAQLVWGATTSLDLLSARNPLEGVRTWLTSHSPILTTP